jgi:hypothetical protein
VNLFDSNGNSTLRALVFCLLLAGICYANSLTNAFILDDILIVAANEKIRHIAPIDFLLQSYWRNQGNGAGIYRPLTIFSFSLDYSLWELWAPGYRLINLLIHALNGWLVFLLARGLLKSNLAAWAAAAVYVMHPVQTEAVVSIVGRSELLAAAFFFAAWLAFRNGRTWLAAGAYVLAALAKESAITFPAIAILDVALTGEGGMRKVLQSWRRFAVLAAAGIAYLGLRFYVLGALGVPPHGQYLNGTLTLMQRWMTSGRVFIEYFILLLAPVNVTGDYDFDSVPLAGLGDWDAWFGLVLVLGCLLLALRYAKTRPKISLGILFFFVTLLPVSNWIMPIALLMAERFLYTPVFGFALLAGAVWAGIQNQNYRRLIAGGVITVSVLLCITHNYVWQDTFTFHDNAVRLRPNNARARLGYGFALLRVDRVEEAKVQFEEGLKIMPRSTPLMAGLAGTFMRLDGNCDRVRPLLMKVLTRDPGQWHSLWVLGDCFLMEGKPDLAEQSYRFAVQSTDFPDAKLLFSWGRVLESQGKTPTAVAAYERAAVIDPTDEGIRTRLREMKGQP